MLISTRSCCRTTTTHSKKTAIICMYLADVWQISNDTYELLIANRRWYEGRSEHFYKLLPSNQSHFNSFACSMFLSYILVLRSEWRLPADSTLTILSHSTDMSVRLVSTRLRTSGAFGSVARSQRECSDRTSELSGIEDKCGLV